MGKIDSNKLVRDLKEEKAAQSKKQVYFRLRQDIVDKFKEKCSVMDVSYGDVMERLMEDFIHGDDQPVE